MAFSFYTGPYAFLTTKPVQRRLSMSHPEWLYIMPTQDISSAGLTYEITYTDGDTTTETISLGDLKEGKVKQVAISDDVRDYNQHEPTKTIQKIEMYIDDSGYDKLTYYPYTPQLDHVRAIYYHNSFGGIDSLILEGSQQDSYEFSAQTTRQPMEIGFTLASDVQIRMINPRANKIRQVNTGSKPKNELIALRDLFLIKRAYEYITLPAQISDYPFLVPIIPNIDSITLPGTRDNIHQMSFSYTYATEQRSYDRVS